MMRLFVGPIPRWQKKIILVLGLLLALVGLPLALGSCLAISLAASEGATEARPFLAALLTALSFTLGAGGLTAWHALRSLGHKPSRTLRLASPWVLLGLFGLAIAVAFAASAVDALNVLLFPPAFIVAAAMPPLWAIAWFIRRSSASVALTWRRAVPAFAGGATLGVALALVLEVLLPLLVLTLVAGLADVVLGAVESLLEALGGGEVASAVTGPGFVYAFIQLALIAPLAEELVKPLITLPLVGRVSRRTAFLMGALAGAGFAALENLIYAGAGLSFWAGILLVRALGAAIHPLGAGLMAQGWRAVLRGEPGSGRTWLARFGLATGMHALWNGGSLLVITLAGAGFFGDLPPRIDVLGLSAAGTTLAFLILLGLAALWLGRVQAERAEEDLERPTPRLVLDDREAALWALACLLALAPAGIAGLKLVLGGSP
jgi:RsiW-degrading membrane proteinase PrsW (M82 family)